ncbi:D-alanyl-D-alanine carboxypeptidase [Streptomyces sp. NPDC003832]
MSRGGASRGGVDTATRVLSARDLADARAVPEPAGASDESEEPEESKEPVAEGGPASDSGSVSGSEPASEPASDSEPDAGAEDEADPDSGGEPAAPKAGNDRLRAAVAAWVATGDEKEPATAGEAPGAADGPESGSEAADGPADGPEDAEAEPEALEGSEDAEATEPGARATEADADDDAPADDEAPEDSASTGGEVEDDTDTETDTRSDAAAEPEVEAEPESDADASDTEPDEDAPKAPATADADADADTDEVTDTGDAAAPAPTPRAKVVDQPTTAIRLRPSADRTGTDKTGPDKGTADRPADDKPAAGKSTAAEPTAAEPAAPKPPTDPTPATPPPAGPPPVDRATSRFVALKPDVTAHVPQVGPERTTQQPLPPKPPLDLLAELTNTPPPPETPVRTLVRRVKIWTPLVLLLVIVFAIAQAVRPVPAPTLELTAKSSFTFEGSKVDIPWPADGQAALDVQGIGSFGSSGEQKPVPIASVAKVMTAYVILRDHPLKSGAEGPKIQIDQTAEEQSDAGQESTVDVTAGDAITEREALESILIASANNVARLLARWDAGSEKAFVAKMNAAAEDLGMSDTTYTDPSGLNDTTVSTAVDQVKLAKAAMEQPVFREVAAMMSYDDYKGQNHGNWNQLVGSNNVVGIKTGTTTSALGNLVFAAKKEVDGEMRTIVGAVVRQPDSGSGILAAALNSGDQLIRAAQGALESATLLKKGDVVGYVDDGLGGRTAVVATEDVKAAGWAGLKVELDFTADAVPHEAKAGTKVGTLTVGDGGTAGAVKVPVALQSDLVEPGFTAKLTRIT